MNGKFFNSRMTVTAQLMFLMLIVPALVSASSWQWMSPQRFSALVKEGSGLWLVDVRSETAFAELHIEGAVHIPAEVMTTKHLPKGKIIVLVDDSLGLRKGREAAGVLLRSGNDKVFLLEGGITAWQNEGYPVAGNGYRKVFRGVMPDDILWAMENHVPLRILDLRDKDEQVRGPVPQALAVDGKSLPERLEKAKEMMEMIEKKGLSSRLEKPATTILVFPAAVEPRPVLESSLRGITGDVRFLEGGYAAWNAKPDKKVTSNRGGCPTCPGGVSGGKK
jgi:rhodanese-related sulfurtransferase